MSKTIQAIAQISAGWWADKVSHPKFDNGDGANVLAGIMASMSVNPLNDELRTKFIKALSETIATRLEHGERKVILDVDYGPCRELSQAAEQSGVSRNNFPWKTVMWISEHHIAVRYGYCADEEVLYASKRHWEDGIKSSIEAIKRYQNGEYFDWMTDEIKKLARVNKAVAELQNQIVRYRANLETAED